MKTISETLCKTYQMKPGIEDQGITSSGEWWVDILQEEAKFIVESFGLSDAEFPEDPIFGDLHKDHRIRYEFDDGSAIVRALGRWDFGVHNKRIESTSTFFGILIVDPPLQFKNINEFVRFRTVNGQYRIHLAGTHQP